MVKPVVAYSYQQSVLKEEVSELQTEWDSGLGSKSTS